MQEPNWDELRERLSTFKLRELKPIKKKWFNGVMEGASGKQEIVMNMISAMRHWWRSSVYTGQTRVANIIDDIAAIDGGWKVERNIPTQTAYYAIEFGKEVSNG